MLINIENQIPNFNNFVIKLKMNYNIINSDAAFLHQQYMIRESKKKKKESFFNRIFDTGNK